MASIDPKSTPPGVEPKKARSDKDILEEARERLKKCIDDYSEERKKQKDDVLFSILDQWDSGIRAAREGDPNGPRPCLTIDQINQYIVQVVNDMRQNKPAVKVRPIDDQADIGTAEVFQGIVRQIEDQSVAQVAYASSGESAVRAGEGYFRIITEYENETSFDQIIRIKRVPDMFCVYLGPHEMPDGSDAEYGFVFEWMPLQKFRRNWPEAKYTATEFNELQTDYQGNWYDNEKICVTEYFYFDYERQTIIQTQNGSMTKKEYDALEDKPPVIDERDTRIQSTKWCKLTGVEILEKRDWAGKYIPIVKVVGKEVVVDGKKKCWGLVRPAKDSLRMYNYWASAITEKIGLSPKVPYIGAKGQFENLEDRWQQANVQNYPYLEYNPVSIDGLSVPPPKREQPAQIEVAMIQQLQIIREDVQASLGMFKASLGKEQPNQSGKAILALTRESDTGTFHFADNQSISIMYCGRILIDLIPKIYDTARIVKILGEDGKPRTAELDPNQPQASAEIQDPLTGKVQTIYNLGVGTYDVTVTTGPSFNTKRMEAATLFTDLANTSKDPISATVMRYLAIKNSDFNGAEQAAEMMEKLLPPGLIQKEGQPNVDPRAQAVINQLQMALQEQGKKLQEAETGEKVKEQKVMADHDAKMKALELERVETEARLQLERDVAIEKAKLDREVAFEKVKLEREVANEEANLEREVANEGARIEQEKVAIDKEVKMDGLVPKDIRDNYMKGEAMKEHVNPIKDEIKGEIGSITQVMTELATKIENSKPVSIKRIKDKDGNITGGVATYANGETRTITIN